MRPRLLCAPLALAPVRPARALPAAQRTSLSLPSGLPCSRDGEPTFTPQQPCSPQWPSFLFPSVFPLEAGLLLFQHFLPWLGHG